MNSSSDNFNGNYIHIDNNIKNNLLDKILFIEHAGSFIPDYCPKAKKQSDDGYMFMAIHSGKGIVSYKDEINEVSQGQCVYIDCSLPHYYAPDPSDPWGVTWINFNGPSAKEYYNFFLKNKDNFFTPNNYDMLHIILTKIINNNLHKTEIINILNAKLITDLLTSAILNNVSSDDCTNKFKNKLLYVKEYLDNNYTKQLNLDQIAEQFYVSKFYLIREFKKSFGTTIIQYILNKRIEYAKELLIYTNKSVEEISEECGFNDQSYFARQFKKSENMTCLAYRRKHI